MRRMKSGLVAAMEQEDLQKRPEEGELGDHAESLETDLTEIAEDQADGDAEQEQVVEASETKEALESLLLSMESASENGGLDKHGAAVLRVSLEHMYSRVGITLTRKSLPALESFGGASSRQGATQLAMEDIKGKVKEIWEAIKKAIKKAIDWVMGYYNKVFGAAEKLGKRAKSLAERAENTNGKAKNANFENERLVKSLFVGNAVPANSSGAAKLHAVAKEFYEKYANQVGKGGEELVETFEKMGDEKEVYAAIQVMATPLVHSSKVTVDDAPEGTEAFRSDELPGGKALWSFVPTSAFKGGKAGGALRPFDAKAKDPSTKNVPTLSVADAGKIAEMVEEISTEMIGFRKNSEEGTKLMKRMLAASEKIGSNASEEKDDKREAMKMFQKVAAAAAQLFTQPGTSFNTYVLNASKALLDQVELSLKQYESK